MRKKTQVHLGLTSTLNVHFDAHRAGDRFHVRLAGEETAIDELDTLEEARASAVALALVQDFGEMAGEVSQFAGFLVTMRPDSQRENAAVLIRIKDLHRRGGEAGRPRVGPGRVPGVEASLTWRWN
jgi:hypothetical protein